MNRIDACENEDCEKKISCWRYMCIRNNYQTFRNFKYICSSENSHKWFYEIDGKQIRVINLGD